MIEEIQAAAKEYQQKWQTLVENRADKAFFESFQPKSYGWKVPDLASYEALLAELRPYCDMIHNLAANDRWLAVLHFHDVRFAGDVQLVTVLQRRPDSQDKLGFDNCNLYSPQYHHAEEVLDKEPNLKWTHESNGAHSSWISLWFDGTEAKLRNETTVDVIIKELGDIRDRVMG